MTNEGVTFGTLEGKILIRISNKVAVVNVADVPKLIDFIMQSAKIASEYNKQPKIIVPGDDF